MRYRVLYQEAGSASFAALMDKDWLEGNGARERAQKKAEGWVKERSGRRAEVVGIVHSYWSSVDVHTDAPQISVVVPG